MWNEIIIIVLLLSFPFFILLLYFIAPYKKCDKCKVGNIKHEGTEYTPRGIPIEVYKCDNCKERYL